MRLSTIRQQDRINAYNLTKPQLLRIILIRQDDNHYTLLKSEHHSIADGWSGPVLLEQVTILIIAY